MVHILVPLEVPLVPMAAPLVPMAEPLVPMVVPLVPMVDHHMVDHLVHMVDHLLHMVHHLLEVRNPHLMVPHLQLMVVRLLTVHLFTVHLPPPMVLPLLMVHRLKEHLQLVLVVMEGQVALHEVPAQVHLLMIDTVPQFLTLVAEILVDKVTVLVAVTPIQLKQSRRVNLWTHIPHRDETSLI